MENHGKITNRVDCIFYLFIMDEEPSVTCKDSLQRKIFERFNKVLDFDCDSYAMHSGAYIRSSATLKEEFAGMIPVQVKIVIFYRKTGLVSLLSPEQRNMIFDAVMESVEDEDTVDIIKRVLDSTPYVEDEWI